MADRRLLEDGSLRLQEDGASFRALEQQSTIGVTASVTEADDTLAATLLLGAIPGYGAGAQPIDLRHALSYVTYTNALPLMPRRALELFVREESDSLKAELVTGPARRAVQRRRALNALLMH